MKLIEKRDFIHRHLHQLDEAIIDKFYEILRKEETLRNKLISRAEKSEDDIENGRVFSREEIEKRTNSIIK